MSTQPIKKGDKVQFMFQGKWTVNHSGYEYPNEGKVIQVDGRSVVVQSPNYAKYYLSDDMMRKV